MLQRKNIIVRMSLMLVSAMIIISAGIGVWFERRIVAEANAVMYEEVEIGSRIISQALTAFMEKNSPVVNDQLRSFILSIKPDNNLDVSIIDTDGTYILEPKPDIATGSDALVMSRVMPNTGWTVVYTYPRHVYNDYVRSMGWRMLLIGVIAIILVLATIVFIVRFVGRPFVIEQQRLVETKASMEREIEIAGKIQQNFLPHDLSGIEAILLPAKNIGGDFYDVIVQDGICYFCMGDVSGKGIPASMFMASTIMLFRRAVRDEHLDSPAAIMREINRTIERENKHCMFVTMFIGVLNECGKLTYCNAGHCSPVVDGAFLPPAECMPIGAFGEAEYADESISLSVGDSVFLYTDGVTEAKNDHGEFFGEKRLLNLFDAFAPTTDDVLSAVRTFAGAAEQSDDITMLKVVYMPVNTLQFDRISSRLGSTSNIVSEVLKMAASLHADVPDSMRMIVEELIVNIASYSYPAGKDWNDKDSLWITVEYIDSSFVLTFRDHGIPFNPLEATTPDFSLSVEERSIGGLGIFLVKQISSDISYSYSDNTNILRVTCA